MLSTFWLLFSSLGTWLRSRTALQAEILSLRHQLLVLERSQRGRRLRLHHTDRVLWVWLSRLWQGWRSVVRIVKPDTIISWSRKGFRLYWRWQNRARQGRPSTARDVRDLIRKMSLANPGWGAPRIHGELLKLGINVGETTVAKYLVRPHRPPSQTWRPFSPITSTNWFPLTSLLFPQRLSVCSLCSWCYRMTVAGYCISV